MAAHRIDQQPDEQGRRHIDTVAHPLCHRAGHDCCSGARKDRLEHKKRVLPIICLLKGKCIGSEPAAIRSTKHQPEAEHIEGTDRHQEIGDVLLRNVDAVLGPRHARFDQKKAQLHQQDQSRGDECPRVVRRKLKLLHGV